MEKNESGALSLVERVQVDGFEFIIKNVPEAFQLVATEGAKQLGIIKTEVKELEILEQQKINNGSSSDENNFEPLGKKLKKEYLKRHIRKVHKKPNDRYRCAKCSEAFGSMKELNRHSLKVHYDGKLFECHCGSMFKEIKHLKSHMVKVHPKK